MFKRLKKIAILTSMFMIISTLSVFAASITNLTVFQAELTKNFASRQTSFVINYRGDTNELMDQFNEVFNKTLSADDYLHYSLSSYNADLKGVSGNVDTTVTATYVDTAEEEAYVTAQVPKILSQIITTNMTDGQKVKAVYDWLITHVSYDNTLQKYSSYDALMGSSVCQGYALLMDKMLGELGVPTNIVTGTLEGVSHAWNQCKIDGVWYFFDATNGVTNKNDYFGQTTVGLTNKSFDWVKTDYPVVTSEYPYTAVPALSITETPSATTNLIVPVAPTVVVVQGWKQSGGAWSYFKLDGTKQTGWLKTGVKWYYLSSNGLMATGWDLINGKWYYLNSTGDMSIGWKLIGKTWYYLNPNSGAMAVNTKVGGYYLGSNGAMKVK